METICIKLEKTLAKTIDEAMKNHHYATKTEFVREALREKIHNLETKEALKQLEKYYGASPLRTTDKDLRRAREKIAQEWDKEFNQ